MPFIDIPLDDAKEGESVPEGEYDVRVAKFELTTSKKAREQGKSDNMYVATIIIEDQEYPNPLPIRDYFVLPDGKKDEHANLKLLNLKRFLNAFDVPFEGNGFNDEDVEGSTAKLLVTLTEVDEDGNQYNRIRYPRIAA